MGRFWRDLFADPKHGPLPAVLLVLTFVTGLVDAVSILSPGRVFVANMTGNVVFVGFALAGAAGFSLAASLSALAGFVAGALGGGRMISRWPARPTLIRAGLGVEAVFLAAALVIAAPGLTTTSRDLVAAAAAVAMGTQNSVVRALKVPDLTTTVLTLTVTGIAADFRTVPHEVTVRRVLAVVTMLLGAVVGAVLVIHVDPVAALGLAVWLVTFAFVAVTRTASWS